MNPVDQYIEQFPSATQQILKTLRMLVLEYAPDAEESLAYGLLAYKTYQKPLIYFGAYPNHIGLYATSSGHQVFQPALAAYKQGKGSVQFPLHQPIPYALIKQIIQYRVQENKELYQRQSA